MTSVVDANYRKVPSKPPVLSPKPNPSEIVKRLSFKRDGPESPRGDRADTESGELGRVSSMIARLSNGARQTEELNTNTINSDRKQFMSKFIKNDKEIPECKQQISRLRENKNNGMDEVQSLSNSQAEEATVSDNQVEDVVHDIPDINIQANGVELAKVHYESSSPALDKFR